MANSEDQKKSVTRREFLAEGLRMCGVLALGGGLGLLTARAASARSTVWQIDPKKCIRCGKCQTECVVKPSAVKCVHSGTICGYCNLCFGYFKDQLPTTKTEGNAQAAENQRCPTGAIERKLVEDPYYQYHIDYDKCIGCGICVDGCINNGNGSMQLQVVHDYCLNCNQCAIAAACPANAFSRIPAEQAYTYKKRQKKAKGS